MNSTFGHRSSVVRQTGFVEIHATDALPRGIHDGDQVRLFNDRGAFDVVAQVSDSVSRAWSACRAGAGTRVQPTAQASNVSTSDRLTDIGGGPTFFSCLVDAVRADDTPRWDPTQRPCAAAVCFTLFRKSAEKKRRCPGYVRSADLERPCRAPIAKSCRLA